MNQEGFSTTFSLLWLFPDLNSLPPKNLPYGQNCFCIYVFFCSMAESTSASCVYKYDFGLQCRVGRLKNAHLPLCCSSCAVVGRLL